MTSIPVIESGRVYDLRNGLLALVTEVNEDEVVWIDVTDKRVLSLYNTKYTMPLMEFSLYAKETGVLIEDFEFKKQE
jgi:hypothetical protein